MQSQALLLATPVAKTSGAIHNGMSTKVGHPILPAEVGHSKQTLAAQARINRARCEDSNALVEQERIVVDY